MSKTLDAYLNYGPSDESDNDQGYDSEAAEISRTSRAGAGERARKKRKLSHSSDSEEEVESDFKLEYVASEGEEDQLEEDGEQEEEEEEEDDEEEEQVEEPQRDVHSSAARPAARRKDKDKKPKRPGVIYLSSLPPYLRPSALRNILDQRGFSPITRLFLAPTSTTRSKSKSSRQMYSEGWIEFASHKTAKKCVDGLNAQPVGGKKGGYYRDDVWNMRYLRGMAWKELMEGVQGERRDEEARRDEERRRADREAKVFIEGVEEGRVVEGMKEKRRKQGKEPEGAAGGGDLKRTWRQFEVKGHKKRKEGKEDGISQETQAVLGKIF